MKIRPRERPRHVLCVPSIVERAVCHGKGFGKYLRPVVVHRRNADLAALPNDFRQPLIAQCQTRLNLVRAIDIRAPPQTFFFRRDGINNHPLHRGRTWRIQPAHEQERVVFKIGDRPEALEVRIRHNTRNLRQIGPEHGKFRIHRSFVAISNRSRTCLVARIICDRANL